MRVSLAEVGRRGKLDLTFTLQDGRTILRDAYCETPFKITRLLDTADSVPHLILMQNTAGVFGGDDLSCSIRVERGARVRITQQSATRIHPSAVGAPAFQRHDILVESGGLLNLHLEPVIPFAHSRLRQSTRIVLEPGARLSFWEGFLAGRIGRGESWQFHELSSETRIETGGCVAYLDRFRILPAHSPASAWAMAGNSYVGSGVYYGAEARGIAAVLREAAPAAGVDALSENLLLMRAVTQTGPEFQRCRDTFCAATAHNTP